MKKTSLAIALLSAVLLAAGASAAEVGPVLNAETNLMPGDMMVSKNRVYELHMQADDGNLVLRRRLFMARENGAVVVYKKHIQTIKTPFSTGAGHGRAYARMQADGNFVVYGPGFINPKFVARYAANGGNQPRDMNYQFVLGEDGSLTIQKGWGRVEQRLYTDDSGANDGQIYLFPICKDGKYLSWVYASGGRYATYLAMQQNAWLCAEGWPLDTFPGTK
ncbi:hypothetical protein [Massilia sp. CF038]|uniref:hypothetical protein n=1 Tax=Massilia sp. CF038 TaxID=1881045 RepID=UPI000923C1F8|nr:hypothetical protein [Massilia sp. CF038]SHG39870.1 hypothetical protein SAMN05428948_0264 [Massilia sp. CF038]